MAIGGYLGDDPILTPSDIERLASDRQLRFVVMLGRVYPGAGKAGGGA